MIYNLVGVDPLDRGATALKTRGLLTEWKPVLVSLPVVPGRFFLFHMPWLR